MSQSASPTPTAALDPTLDPAGDSEANLAYFDFVNRRLLATVPTPNGQQLVENLVTAGFVKADMGNADYWYRRAGKKRSAPNVKAEWEVIASALSGVTKH